MATLLYPMPGEFQDKPLTIHAARNLPYRWRDISEAIAYLHNVTPDEVDCIDAYWGGEHQDENSCDLALVNGDFVGSFDRALSADEWSAVLSVDDNIERARKPDRAA